MPVEIESVFPHTSALSQTLNSTDIVWNAMTMNLTQLTTLVALSACAMAESSTAVSANVLPTPEAPAEIQVPDSIIQLENATIQSIAQPETLARMPEVLTPATVAPATAVPAESIAAPIELAVGPIVEPAVEPAISPAISDRTADRTADVRTADTRIADSRAVTNTIAPRIEVGTRGIPPVTDLPSRISLPPQSLLPANFEFPIVLGQAMDTSMTTASPITDRMADPVWSRRMEDLAAYKTAYSEGLLAWSGRVAQCMNEKPKLYVVRSDGKQLPMYFDGKEGTIIQNKDGVSVCGM